MKIKDIFNDVFKGLSIETDDRITSKIKAYLIDTKDVENCQITYTNLQDVYMNVKDKFFLKPNDIIVATIPSESTCHVGVVNGEDINNEKKAIVKKNFIVLRNISSQYKAEFVAAYLDIIGINDYFNKYKITIDHFANTKRKEALTIDDIKDIDIPNISLSKQIALLSIINPINERNNLYKKLIANDLVIKKHLLNEVIEHEK
jgi:hypothetical protein